MRPELYRYLVEDTEAPLFMKTHDAYTDVAVNTPLIPAEATGGALYFIRNPLDVAVSFAHHSGWNYDTSISRMSKDTFTFCGRPDRLQNQLRQKLLSWSGHVLSWMDRAPFPVCPLCYEDMKMRPLETFTRAVRFADLPHSEEQILKALKFSSFEVVKQQEEEGGFREKSPEANRFFRKGETGSWREALSESQVRRVVHDHRQVMRRFGYLDENDDMVY